MWLPGKLRDGKLEKPWPSRVKRYCHVRVCNLHGSALIQLEIAIDKGRDIVLRIDLQRILKCCHLQMVVLLYMGLPLSNPVSCVLPSSGRQA